MQIMAIFSKKGQGKKNGIHVIYTGKGYCSIIPSLCTI